MTSVSQIQHCIQQSVSELIHRKRDALAAIHGWSEYLHRGLRKEALGSRTRDRRLKFPDHRTGFLQLRLGLDVTTASLRPPGDDRRLLWIAMARLMLCSEFCDRSLSPADRLELLRATGIGLPLALLSCITAPHLKYTFVLSKCYLQIKTEILTILSGPCRFQLCH